VADERRNKEGYLVLPEWEAIRNIDSEERAKKLLSVLLYIIKHSNFELLNRIHLRDKITNKEYK